MDSFGLLDSLMTTFDGIFDIQDFLDSYIARLLILSSCT